MRLLLLLLAIAGGLAAQAPAPPTHRDVVYRTVNETELKLDLYLPEQAAGPYPLVVWIHGGAWRSGNKSQTPARFLLQHGYALASVAYRLSGVAQWPAQIDDCKAAVDWLRANAGKYNLNKDRVAAWGSSAGGHLVAMLGTMGEVQAVVDFFGPTDFLRMNDTPGKMDHNAPDSPESRLIGGPIQENKDKVAKASPLTYVSKGDPPFLIVHGDADPVVIPSQSKLLEAALRKAEVPVELVMLPGAGHGGPQFAAPEVQAKIVAFLNRYLKQ